MNRREFLKTIGALALAGSPLLSGCGPSDPLPENNKNVKENLQKYLMISSDSLYETSEELARFRKKRYHVEHLKISDISAEPDNESIRNFLCDYATAYPDLKYVLLIGDAESIPTFYLEQDGISIPTDFYYSNLKENGELPDITVGRLPCIKDEDLGNIVKKLISSEPIKLENPLLFGHGSELDVYGNLHKEYLSAIGYAPLLLEKTNSYEKDLHIIVENINQGIDAMIYYGHASSFFMYPFSELPLPNLKGRTFILMSGGCENMNFANQSPDLCIGYAFLKHENGSVASIGASRRGGYGYRYSFIEGFFDRTNTASELGELFMNGLRYEFDKAAEAGIISSFTKRATLLGDPALQIRN